MTGPRAVIGLEDLAEPGHDASIRSLRSKVRVGRPGDQAELLPSSRGASRLAPPKARALLCGPIAFNHQRLPIIHPISRSCSTTVHDDSPHSGMTTLSLPAPCGPAHSTAHSSGAWFRTRNLRALVLGDACCSRQLLSTARRARPSCDVKTCTVSCLFATVSCLCRQAPNYTLCESVARS